MSERKICVVTGSRAEYGLLSDLMMRIREESSLSLQIVVTGMHLSPEYGMTYGEIENDGFAIDAKIEMLLSSDTPVGTAKAVGVGIIGFADAFQRLKPDVIVLLGDRFEILAAAQSALFARIPIAHIAGGDITEGAFDDAIRHSISKMSHLHFVTNVDAARRLRQLGENPDHVFHVGSLGIDKIMKMALLSRSELAAALGFTFRERNVLVTFHPVTLDSQDSVSQMAELLRALDQLGNQVGIMITKPNADPEGRALMEMIDVFVADHPHSRAYTSLGQLRYFSMIAQVDAVVGNSSSGLYEVPSFKKPTVNIGDRQKGRISGSSVIQCAPQEQAILGAIREAFDKDCFGTINPYGAGDATERIFTVLRDFPTLTGLLKKRFLDNGA